VRSSAHRAHGVDIRERVGCRDLTIGKRIVDYRSEEIDRVDDRQSVADAEDPGIVARRNTYEHVGMSSRLEPGKRCLKVRRTELACSTGRFAARRQPK
jgi:hypothetical protein